MSKVLVCPKAKDALLYLSIHVAVLVFRRMLENDFQMVVSDVEGQLLPPGGLVENNNLGSFKGCQFGDLKGTRRCYISTVSICLGNGNRRRHQTSTWHFRDLHLTN